MHIPIVNRAIVKHAETIRCDTMFLIFDPDLYYPLMLVFPLLQVVDIPITVKFNSPVWLNGLEVFPDPFIPGTTQQIPGIIFSLADPAFFVVSKHHPKACIVFTVF